MEESVLEDVRTKIREILQKYSEKEVGDGDISLIEDLEFDSLQLIEALTEIEEVFRISFEDGEILLDMVDHSEEMIQYVESSIRQ